MADKMQKYQGFTVYSEKNLLQRIWSVGVGRFFISVLLFIIVILFNILFSWNNAATFLVIFGIEFLLLFIAGWFYFFFKQKLI